MIYTFYKLFSLGESKSYTLFMYSNYKLSIVLPGKNTFQTFKGVFSGRFGLIITICK